MFSGSAPRVRARRRLRFGLLSVALVAAGCTGPAPELPEGVLVISQEQTASWIRNFNPLTPAAAARWPTLCGVYEPLYVFNSLRGEAVPWLATDTEWRDDRLTLRVTLREGVKWSDGTAFTAGDVVFTFDLMKENAGLDRRRLWRFLQSVERVGENQVDFRFQHVFIPGREDVLAQLIVPEHVWSDVDDPVTFPNENPVATGPFTEVRLFRNQVFELGRNPHYWQEGRPRVEALRFPAYPSNDRANLALVFDEVDWAANFVPAIDRVFVERDPEHHDYWFPLTGTTVFLYANTMRAPFDDVRVRKAISCAIDRDLLVDVALFRYSRPSDATALSDAYTGWRDPEVVAKGDWVRFDREAAGAMLDEAGLPLDEDGWRTGPDGKRLRYDILTVSGWSDWVRASQVIARSLQAVGIDASVKTYDFGAWFQRVQEGNFDLSLGWSFEGPTPYVFYRELMSTDTVRPLGKISGSNWHRFGSEEADRVIDAFEVETDPERRREQVAELQRIFSREAPAIPLYPNPSWAAYNTKRFTGFPSPENPYADPSPNKIDRADCLLVLTQVEPREVTP